MCLVLVFGVILGGGAGCSLFQSKTPLLDPNAPSWVQRLNRFDEASIWDGYFTPSDRNERTSLVALERHQPGKIPVVFVHGLASGPTTWQKMLTALNNDPEIRSRFQFWVYRYPTGESYLIAAAGLRRELQRRRKQIDPNGRDPALQNVVLIGHSMGGIVSKLQATSSDNILWESVSSRPFSELKADEPVKNHVRSMFFFEPQPAVKRIVYLATPHHGSRLTESFVGKFARKLVLFPSVVRTGYRQLLEMNSNALLPTNSMTVPTSVDHLSPDSPVLQATTRLRRAAGVPMHSIIGNAMILPDKRATDGAVSLSSARLPNVESELRVPATHTEIHRDERSIREVKRILLLHAGRRTAGR